MSAPDDSRAATGPDTTANQPPTTPRPDTNANQPPAALTVVGFVALGLLALPIVGLLQRTPWSSLPTLLGESEVLEALRLSLVVSVAATAACVVL
ncbi:MAG: hypothetical protein OXC00_09535, partial [Acidimicrobiaceae bacterium]|nr:hypothetical protein [Acidimicrobiaceae bacterium]